MFEKSDRCPSHSIFCEEAWRSHPRLRHKPTWLRTQPSVALGYSVSHRRNSWTLFGCEKGKVHRAQKLHQPLSLKAFLTSSSLSSTYMAPLFHPEILFLMFVSVAWYNIINSLAGGTQHKVWRLPLWRLCSHSQPLWRRFRDSPEFSARLKAALGISFYLLFYLCWLFYFLSLCIFRPCLIRHCVSHCVQLCLSPLSI